MRRAQWMEMLRDLTIGAEWNLERILEINGSGKMCGSFLQWEEVRFGIYLLLKLWNLHSVPAYLTVPRDVFWSHRLADLVHFRWTPKMGGKFWDPPIATGHVEAGNICVKFSKAAAWTEVCHNGYRCPSRFWRLRDLGWFGTFFSAMVVDFKTSAY